MLKVKIKNTALLIWALSRLLIAYDGFDSQSVNQEKSLRQSLEMLRETNNVNFVYADKLIGDISVNFNQDKNLTLDNLNNFLEHYGLSYKKFGDKTFVIIKSDKKKAVIKPNEVIEEKEIAEADTLSLVIKPILIYNFKPPYPYEAVKNKIEGNVRIKFLVGEDGTVSKSKVLATSGYGVLDSAARDFVYNLKYSPGKRNGKPQSTWMSILFRYVLEEKDNKLIPKVSY